MCFLSLNIADLTLALYELINLNGVSTRLGLFYADRLRNFIHCTFIYTFFVDVSKESFTHSYMISSILI